MEKEKMKIIILRIILVILLLSTFFIIFGFSSQDGETSGGLSKKITNLILQKFETYNGLEENEKTRISNRLEKVIRKMAHFSIYTLVGFLLMGIMCTYNIKNKWRVILTIILGIIYATSDEVHQGFTPGRTPKITDVYIDTLGIGMGGSTMLFIKELYFCYKKNKKCQ